MHPSDLWEPRNDVPMPVDYIKRRAKVYTREGRRWIIYPDEVRRGRGKKTAQVIVEMPQDAPTKSCDERRHHQCAHRRGGPHEGGIWLKVTRPLLRPATHRNVVLTLAQPRPGQPLTRRWLAGPFFCLPAPTA